MYERIKNESRNENMYPYTYFVKSIRTKKGPRQKVIRYLGRAKHLRVLRKETVQRVFKRYEHQCAICLTPENLIIDHIIPFKLGGTNEESNLQVLCKECNLRKRDLLLHIPNFKRI